jgi:hypothetical protein
VRGFVLFDSRGKEKARSPRTRLSPLANASSLRNDDENLTRKRGNNRAAWVAMSLKEILFPEGKLAQLHRAYEQLLRIS